MTGTELISSGAELLRATGGKVVIFNSRFLNYNAKGFVDLVWIFRDTTFYIEVKGAGDKMRPAQREFAESISDHCGLHVRYRIITTLDGFEQIAREGAGIPR
jgi:hypothetical protein